MVLLLLFLELHIVHILCQEVYYFLFFVSVDSSFGITSRFFFCENEKIKLKFNQRRSWDHYTFFVWPLGTAIQQITCFNFWALAQLNLLKSFLEQMNDLSFFLDSLDAFDLFFSFNKWNCELVIRSIIYFLWIGINPILGYDFISEIGIKNVVIDSSLDTKHWMINAFSIYWKKNIIN